MLILYVRIYIFHFIAGHIELPCMAQDLDSNFGLEVDYIV